MSLSLEEVEHIAALARLSLSEAEKAHYRQQLSAILDYAARLQSIDTDGVPPAGAFIDRNRLRPDEARPGLSIPDLLRNAPQAEKDQFVVPPVLDTEP
jgi:aspartyl-tRNA(Asn)/glutamyl-tRNA(Gln) amidotransferase subunit C